MGFKDLTNTQIVAFILGIVFSLLAVAAIFWTFKYSGKIKSKAKIALYTMILPFIAIASWLILIFSFVDGFKQDDLLNIFVSIALSLVICFMILTVAYVLYQKNKDKFVEEEAVQEIVETNTEVVEENSEPVEQKSEEAKEEVSTEPEDAKTEEITEETNEVIIEAPQEPTSTTDDE